MFSTPISNTINQKVYLLFGRTQSCKSSFIKDICGENTPIEIQTGFRGTSTTKSLKFYSGSNPNLLNGTPIYFIDTVGWGDSNEDFSNDEIMQMISYFLLQKTNQNHIDGILVTETMTNDSICLKNSLALLHQIFGVSVVDSSIVLATKSSAVADKEDLEERFDQLQKIVTEKKIRGGAMQFKTSYRHLPKGSFNFVQQLRELTPKLSSLSKLYIANIEAQRQAIAKRAREIQKQRTTRVFKWIPYTEVVYETEKVQRTKVVVLYRTVEETHKERFLGIRVGRYTNTYQVPNTETIIYWEDVQTPRNVKKQRCETIENVPEYDVCWKEAFEEHKRMARSLVQKR